MAGFVARHPGGPVTLRGLASAAALALLCGALAACSALGGGGGSADPTGAASPRTASPGPAASEPASAGPASGRAASPAAAKLAVAQRTHEYPGPRTHQTATSGAANPVFVIQAFATGYINWTAATVSRTMRALTQISVGQARSVVTLAAAQTARDYELKRGGIANTGVVEAIAPVVGHGDEYAVVTQERTTAAATSAYAGLAPAWHLALATVTRLRPGQWVVSAWQPEN